MFRGLALLLLAACTDTRARAVEQADAGVDRAPFRAGVRFDPSTLRGGGRVGVLVADSVRAHRSVVDSSWVGTAWFRGDIELTGWTLPHPDPDQRNVAMCFEADSASAARLPRWQRDERRLWFCFENRDDAARVLGAPGDSVPARVVISGFTIHRGLSDEVNAAHFVRGVRR